jgi:hypothetical protein
MYWELRVRSEDSGGAGGIWYFETKPSHLQCLKMYYSVAGDYPPAGNEKYSLRRVPIDGQSITPLPR